MLKTPVILLIYNRPDETRRVFNAIKKIEPDKIFIVADGPKDNRDIDKIFQTRSLVADIDWTDKVYRNYSDKNLGLAKRIESGLNWAFSKVTKAIILEDDCLPTQSFFYFCQKMLDKYEYNKKVMMIGGTNYLIDKTPISHDYFFSKYFSIWGWATWSDAWEMYDAKMNGWPEFKSNKKLAESYSKFMQKKLTRDFDLAYAQKINSWAIKWFFSCIKNDGLCLVPRLNQISNIGIEGVHTKNKHHNNFFPAFDIQTDKLTGPKKIKMYKQYDNIFFENEFRPKFILKRKLNGFKKRLSAQRNYFKNVARTNFKKNCLIVYLTQPFKNQEFNHYHQNLWQVKKMPQIISKFGYNVDVIDYKNTQVKLNKKYDLVIDIFPGYNQSYTGMLNKNATLIGYFTGSNHNFANNAELDRIENLYCRRGVRVSPKRIASHLKQTELDKCKASFFLGNNYNWQTYKEFDMPQVYFIKNNGYDFLIDKFNNFEKKNQKQFLFWASKGQVHKGLDILLEIFAKHQDLELFICSRFDKEPYFVKVYKREIYSLPNIYPIGFISIESNKFKQIAQKCGYMVLPSCSEANAGSVLTAKSAGIIPLVSRESGFDESEVIHFPNNSIDMIEKYILDYSQKDLRWVKNTAKQMQLHIKKRYSMRAWEKSFEMALKKTLNK